MHSSPCFLCLSTFQFSSLEWKILQSHSLHRILNSFHPTSHTFPRLSILDPLFVLACRSCKLLLRFSAPFIAIHFLVFLLILSNSCFHHFNALAPYRNTATVHVFMAKILFFQPKFDFKTSFSLCLYSLENIFFITVSFTLSHSGYIGIHIQLLLFFICGFIPSVVTTFTLFSVFTPHFCFSKLHPYLCLN